jgi:hypothetical protein
MAKKKQKQKKLRIWRALLLTFGGGIVFLLMFVAAFIFNPFEGSLPELRDIVPRGVSFFVRKQMLSEDFDPFPEPKFWAELSSSPGYQAVESAGLGRNLKQMGLEQAIRDARTAFDQVKTDSSGYLDIMRDVLGTELIVAGYNQDYSTYPPTPLAKPEWCVYTRVSWRVKAALGLVAFGFVQDMMQEQGLGVSKVDDVLVITPFNGEPIYISRHLDAVLIANSQGLLEQADLLMSGNRDEEPIGQQPAYTDGALARIDEWAADNGVSDPNVIEFVVEPNAFDGFRRFAATWPNPQNKDSMNERVLASFLNLKGWLQITGGLLFEDGVLGATGQIGLNSNQHTSFQSSFYTAEKQQRERWLDPFFDVVPQSACAAAALRMPVGEFLNAMFDSLDPDEQSLIDDGLRRAEFRGQQLQGMRDLIKRLSLAFRPRTGFVFRRNIPDLTKNEKGELDIPVAAKSPMPQVAWVFWLHPRGVPLANDLVKMLRENHQSFGFRKVWHLKVPFAGRHLPDPVTEFTNPQIPGTGQIAMLVLREFFCVSNSGPLIQDIVRTRYGATTGMDSVLDSTDFEDLESELSNSLNGLVWMDGANLRPVLDDYLNFADSSTVNPDPDWMRMTRPQAEDYVRRKQYPRYPSKASMPRSLTQPGGEFDKRVVAYLRRKWSEDRTNFTAEDRESIQQLRGLAEMFRSAALQLELQNNYIHYQARITSDRR